MALEGWIKIKRGNRHSLKMGFVHVNVLDRFVLNVAGGRFPVVVFYLHVFCV